MAGESGGSRIFINELHSSEMQGDERAGESSVTRRIIDELHFFG